jgi:hypothetical protein
MIQLKPNLKTSPTICPNCENSLTATDFLLTGMRNLADCFCPHCQAEFYGDLPAGQGIYTPVLLDKKTGATSGYGNAKWFADWLTESFQNRTNAPLPFETCRFSPVKDKVILLNCLDTLYGHVLLKLLNAQSYLQTDLSLVVIIPPFLEWMLPAGVAEAWIVDLPLRRGTEWNDWLAAEFARKLADFKEVFLSPAFSHPHPDSFEIERFTGIEPFNLEKFDAPPVVTFIWREDRLWESEKKKFWAKNPIAGQFEKVVRFAEILRNQLTQLDFAVVGLGKTGDFPDWIKDLRRTKLNADDEREWCRRYAGSQAVVGVHGSNMLLPSAHAGGVIELLPEDRQGNFLQDILVRPTDARETLFRYRFAPLSTSPDDLVRMVEVLLRYEDFRWLMNPNEESL